MATHVVNNVQKVAVADKTFCSLPPAVIEAIEQEAVTTTYPTGAVLFAEGQPRAGCVHRAPRQGKAFHLWQRRQDFDSANGRAR